MGRNLDGACGVLEAFSEASPGGGDATSSGRPGPAPFPIAQEMTSAGSVEAALASGPGMFIQNVVQLEEKLLFQVRGGGRTI